MARRKFHNDLSLILFGTSGSDIHKFMDALVKKLGRNHRSERHDSNTVALLYAIKGKEAAQHALAHIILDESASAHKKGAERLIQSGMQKTLKEIKQIKRAI